MAGIKEEETNIRKEKSGLSDINIKLNSLIYVMSKLVYCASPSRLVHRVKDIMDFVTDQGYAPLHPFQALPYERFEGNPGSEDKHQ